MAFFEWKDEYSIGIQQIDNQHKKILAFIEEIFESIRDSREDLIINEILDDLLEYSKYHFGLEMKLFEEYSYRKIDEHIKAHEHFINEITALKIEIERRC